MVQIPSFVIRFLTVIAISGFMPISAQHLNSIAGGEAKLLGRIVLYDWVWHETTQNDDFVIKLLDAKATAQKYARVIYMPSWGWDAPRAEAKDILDRWAFVGKGTKWQFAVHAPSTAEEKNACKNSGGSSSLDNFL